MKKNLLWYLVSFLGLLNIFQYVNSTNVFNSQSKKISIQQKEINKLRDSTEALFLKTLDLNYFDLSSHEDALDYFNDLDLENPEAYILDKLIETNEIKGNNPYVPYEGLEGGVMKINKIKVLNHKWIIADFSDGKYWGELFINYQIDKNLDVKFTVTDYLLFAPQK